MTKIHHAYAATAKRALLFVAPIGGGAWRLANIYPAHRDVSRDLSRAQGKGFEAKVIVTDDAADVILRHLTQTSQAYAAAGIGPARPLPRHLQPAGAKPKPAEEQKSHVQVQPGGSGKVKADGPSRRRPSRSKKARPPTCQGTTDGQDRQADLGQGNAPRDDAHGNHDVKCTSPTSLTPSTISLSTIETPALRRFDESVTDGCVPIPAPTQEQTP